MTAAQLRGLTYAATLALMREHGLDVVKRADFQRQLLARTWILARVAPDAGLTLDQLAAIVDRDAAAQGLAGLDGWFSHVASIVTGGGSNVIQASVTTAQKGIDATVHGNVRGAIGAAAGGVTDAGREFAKFLRAPGDLSNQAVQRVAPGRIADLSQRITVGGDKVIDKVAPIVLQAIVSYFTGGIYSACASIATVILDQLQQARAAKSQAELDAALARANGGLDQLKAELARLQAQGVASPPGFNASIADTATAVNGVQLSQPAPSPHAWLLPFAAAAAWFIS